MSDDLKAKFLDAKKRADADAQKQREKEQERLAAEERAKQERFEERANTLKRLFGGVLQAALEAYADLPQPFKCKSNLEYKSATLHRPPGFEFGFGEDVARITYYSEIEVHFPGRHREDTWSDRTKEFGMGPVNEITEDKIVKLIEHLLRQHKGLEKRHRY